MSGLGAPAPELPSTDWRDDRGAARGRRRRRLRRPWPRPSELATEAARRVTLLETPAVPRWADVLVHATPRPARCPGGQRPARAHGPRTRRALDFLGSHRGVGDKRPPPAGPARRDARPPAGTRGARVPRGCRVPLHMLAAVLPLSAADARASVCARARAAAAASCAWHRRRDARLGRSHGRRDCSTRSGQSARVRRALLAPDRDRDAERDARPRGRRGPSSRCWRARSSARRADSQLRAPARSGLERPLHRRRAVLHRGARRDVSSHARAVAGARHAGGSRCEAVRLRRRLAGSQRAPAIVAVPPRALAPLLPARPHGRVGTAGGARRLRDLADRLDAPLVRPPRAATSRSSACSARRRTGLFDRTARLTGGARRQTAARCVQRRSISAGSARCAAWSTRARVVAAAVGRRPCALSRRHAQRAAGAQPSSSRRRRRRSPLTPDDRSGAGRPSRTPIDEPRPGGRLGGHRPTHRRSRAQPVGASSGGGRPRRLAA